MTPVGAATAAQTANHISQDDNGTFQVSRETVVRYGHSYQRLLVEGQARVHLGGQIVVNHYYGQPAPTRAHSRPLEVGKEEDNSLVVLAAAQLLQNFKGDPAQLSKISATYCGQTVIAETDGGQVCHTRRRSWRDGVH